MPKLATAEGKNAAFLESADSAAHSELSVSGTLQDEDRAERLEAAGSQDELEGEALVGGESLGTSQLDVQQPAATQQGGADHTPVTFTRCPGVDRLLIMMASHKDKISLRSHCL
jgi:hypothetical protein